MLSLLLLEHLHRHRADLLVEILRPVHQIINNLSLKHIAPRVAITWLIQLGVLRPPHLDVPRIGQKRCIAERGRVSNHRSHRSLHGDDSLAFAITNLQYFWRVLLCFLLPAPPDGRLVIAHRLVGVLFEFGR